MNIIEDFDILVVILSGCNRNLLYQQTDNALRGTLVEIMARQASLVG